MADKMYTELQDVAKTHLKQLLKKGDLSASEMEAAKNALSVIIKSDEACDCEEMKEYSNRGYSMSDDPYRRWEIRSYNSRRRYPRHSMIGDDRDDFYGNGDRGYSRHSIKDRAVNVLERLMDEAGSDYERQKVRDFVRYVESAE